MTASWILKASSLSVLFFVGNLPSFAASIKVEPLPLRDLITLRVTVTDGNGDPIPGLKDDFQLFVDGKPIDNDKFTVTPALESPTPTKLVILLDASGSMEEEDNTDIKRKTGAISAIEEIQKTFRNQPVEVKLIPFGEKGDVCRNNDFVPSSVADSLQSEKFLKLSDSTFTKKLNDLKDKTFCASTDLYNPIIQTLESLQQEKNKASLQGEIPKLGIILLSDGFHSHNRTCQDNTDEQLFNQLQEKAKKAKDIPIYTVGYGLSSSSLQAEMRKLLNDPNPPLDSQAFVCKYEKLKKEGNRNYREIEKKFIDHKRLKDISQLTDGAEYQTFESAAGVSDILEKFVRTILGKYDIKYHQKPAIEAQPHTVLVKIPKHNIESKETTFKITKVSLKRMKTEELLIGFLIGLGGVIAWIFAFSKWSKSESSRSFNQSSQS
jgi:hypothetical protein